MNSKVDKRRMEIIRIMQSEGEASVSELARVLGVTTETLRADVDYLAKQHGWVRTHGGIQLKEVGKFSRSYLFHERQADHMMEKKKLCYRAMELISDGDCIFIDSGSTVIYLLNYINQKRNITIVTHSIGFLIRYTVDGFEKIFKEQGHRLIFLGGEVEANIMMTYGAFFEQVVKEFTYDHVIFSVDAMDEEVGATNVDYQAYSVIKSVFLHARSKVLLADSSKFGLRSTYKVIGLEELDYIITNQPLKEPWENIAKQKNSRFILA
jgi:DeoR/GlpR family transcriptional regulator of sugar metabolism